MLYWEGLKSSMKKSGFLSKISKEGKLKLVDPSQDVSESYLLKSQNCIKSSKILLDATLFENSVSEAYYAMYNSMLSLLFKCGIKCENHSAAIILLNKLFNLDKLSKIISHAKKERIDKQYYISKEVVDKESAKSMVSDAEDFALKLRVFSGKLDEKSILNFREKFNKINR